MIILVAADTLSAQSSASTSITVTVFGMEIGVGNVETFKRLYQGQPANSATTLYTAPASTQTLIKTITITNPTGSAQTITFWVAGTADTNGILPPISIDAGGFAVYDDDGWKFYSNMGLFKDGVTGFTGSVGFVGSFGATGFTGSQGTTGFTGSQGTTGFVGSTGISHTLTFGAHLVSGDPSFDGTAAASITSDATSSNTVSTIVARDAAGAFSMGALTATTGVFSGASVAVGDGVSLQNAALILNVKNGYASQTAYVSAGVIKWSMGMGAVTGTLAYELFNNVTNHTILTIASATDETTFGYPVTLSSTLAVTSNIVTYNNIVTAGIGVCANYGSGRVTAKTNVASGTIATYTPAADGTFIITANVLVTATTACTFTVTVTYTDEGNTARTLTLTFSQITGTFLTAITNVTGVGAYEGVPVCIRAKAAAAITIQTAAGGTYTGVTYNASADILQTAA